MRTTDWCGGATRGNGVEGDEITANAKAIKSIPLKADFSKYGIHKIELRGEVLLELAILEKINSERRLQNEVLRKENKKELELYKNARNTAAGSLRLKDSAEVAARKLDAVIYQLGYAEDKNGNDITNILESHDKNLEVLTELGFSTPYKEGHFYRYRSSRKFLQTLGAKTRQLPFRYRRHGH